MDESLDKYEYFKDKYGLIPHIEGGLYKEAVYRSKTTAEIQGFEGERNLCSIIYYLLKEGEPDKFHSLKSEETWMFHSGGKLNLYFMDPDTGNVTIHKLGLDEDADPVITIPPGIIFGAEGGSPYTFLSCIVNPGYDDRDFYMYNKEELIQKYPQNKELIERIHRNE